MKRMTSTVRPLKRRAKIPGQRNESVLNPARSVILSAKLQNIRPKHEQRVEHNQF